MASGEIAFFTMKLKYTSEYSMSLHIAWWQADDGGNVGTARIIVNINVFLSSACLLFENDDHMSMANECEVFVFGTLGRLRLLYGDRRNC